MTEKLQSLSKEEAAEHQKKWGGYNDLPPGFTEITEAEFARGGFGTWCIERIEFRQAIVGKTFANLKLFFLNHGDNYAITCDWQQKKVRFFKFAICFHTYEEIGVEEARKNGVEHFGNCYHVCKCSKCGHLWAYDSSG